LPSNGDKNEWNAFISEKQKCFKPFFKDLNEWVISEGMTEIPANQTNYSSEYLNLYMFPEAIDYTDIRSMPDKWFRFDNHMRRIDEVFELPKEFTRKPGKIVYVSMGTNASADLTLMKRLVSILSKSSHKFIVSKGMHHDKYELADNMWGKQWLPQTKLLPLVDLFITHGGNNSITECLYFGKPMIVTPVIIDQFDNVQRIHEKGFGVRLDPYFCTEQELCNAIEKLISDNELYKKLALVSNQIQNFKTTEKAVDLIENIAQK
jgi:MGT family glycosyltransferase